MTKDIISQVITGTIVAVIASFLGVLCVLYAVQAAAVALQRIMPRDAALGITALSLAVSAMLLIGIWRYAAKRAQARLQRKRALQLAQAQAGETGGPQVVAILQALQTATASKPAAMLCGAALIGLAAGLAPDQVKKVAHSLRSFKTD